MMVGPSQCSGVARSPEEPSERHNDIHELAIYVCMYVHNKYKHIPGPPPQTTHTHSHTNIVH